jgi:hypothetical protein
MIRRPAFLLVVCAMMFCFAHRASAVGVGEVAGGLAVAKASSRAASSAGNALSGVPSAIAQTLNLPLGLLETALFPLPGPTLAGGLTRTVKGLMGPVNLVGSILKLPFSVIKGVAGG